MADISVADEIKKLKELFDCGVLTEEEFLRAKNRVLQGLEEKKEKQSAPQQVSFQKPIKSEETIEINGVNVKVSSITSQYERTKSVYQTAHLVKYKTKCSDKEAEEIVKEILLGHGFSLQSATVSYQDQHTSYQSYTNTDDVIVCPKCGSKAISTGARGLNWTWGLIGAGKTVNRCGNCGHTWKPRG